MRLVLLVMIVASVLLLVIGGRTIALGSCAAGSVLCPSPNPSSPPPFHPHPAGTLVIAVKLADGNAAAGLTVTASSPSMGTWSTTSDTSGVANFIGLPAGAYTINVSRPGFSEQSASAQVVPGSVVTLLLTIGAPLSVPTAAPTSPPLPTMLPTNLPLPTAAPTVPPQPTALLMIAAPHCRTSYAC